VAVVAARGVALDAAPVAGAALVGVAEGPGVGAAVAVGRGRAALVVGSLGSKGPAGRAVGVDWPGGRLKVLWAARGTAGRPSASVANAIATDALATDVLACRTFTSCPFSGLRLRPGARPAP